MQQHALEDGAVEQVPASDACTTSALPQHRHHTSHSSAGGRCRAAAAHVLAAPSKLGHRPLLDQAVVAAMVAGIAIIGQRSRRGRRRGRRRRCCRRAALALSLAAESLLALRPAPLPVREARRAVIRAWSGHRRHSRTADVVVSAAPDLLAHVPAHGGSDGAVWLWRRSGRRMRRRRCRGAADTIMMAAPSLLVERPQSVALAAVWLGSRCRDIRSCRARNEDRRGGCWRTRIQEVDDHRDKRDSYHAIAIALSVVRWHSDLPGLQSYTTSTLHNIMFSSLKFI